MVEIGFYFLLLLFPFLAYLFIIRTYKTYKNVKNERGISGFEVARQILDFNGLDSMYIVEVKGELTDHYDAKQKVIRLSSVVFHGESVASLAMAAFVCALAVQDKERDSLFKIRTFFAPLIQCMIYTSYILFLIGLFFQMVDALLFAIFFAFISLLFQLLTLPVDIKASKNALLSIEKEKIASKEEMDGVKKVLKAVSFISVASILFSTINIIRSFLSNK